MKVKSGDSSIQKKIIIFQIIQVNYATTTAIVLVLINIFWKNKANYSTGIQLCRDGMGFPWGKQPSPKISFPQGAENLQQSNYNIFWGQTLLYPSFRCIQSITCALNSPGH